MSTQDTKLVKFPQTGSGVANSIHEYLEEFDYLKKALENGNYGNIHMICVVIDTEDGPYRYVMGPPGVTKRDVVGLLTWAASKCIHGT